MNFYYDGEDLEYDEFDEDDEHEYDDIHHYGCAKCSQDDAYEYVSTIKPTVLTDVAKLTEYAFVCIASSLWNHENIPQAVSRLDAKCAGKTQTWLKLRNKIFSSTSKLPIPKSVAEDLDKYVCKMEKEIAPWVSYHFRKVFLEKGQDNELYNLIHLIAWYPDATVNCQQTAKNMLTCVRLSEVLKFRFLSTYCLKEEMEKISPKVFSNNFMDYVEFQEHPLIYYWNRYFRNELNEIPTAGNINISMFQHTNVDYWKAKEYFFELLNFDDQVHQAIWLIDTHGILYQSLILKKLNESQRLLVYMDRAAKILLNYAKSDVDYEEFSSTWSNVRNLITEEQFVSLFHELLVQSDKKDDFLIDLWSTASDDFKLHLFNYNNHEIFEKVLSLWKWSDESGLLFKMLSFASPCTKKYLTREEFFVKYCDNLLGFEKITELNRLLEFFLPEKEELIEFKKNLIQNSKSLRTRCLKFYSTGKIKALKIFLAKFLSPELIDQYKKEFLMSSDGILKWVIKNSSVKIEHVISTILDFRHLITQDRLAFLFCELVKARPFDGMLKTFWDSLPADMKLSLLSYNDNEVIEKVFKSLEKSSSTEFVFILLQDVTGDVKKAFTKEPFFREYCEKLLSTNQFAFLSRLMNSCLTENEELLEFKRHIANNSKSFQYRCFSYFSSGNSEHLFEFQRFFSWPDPELFLEARRNVLTSDGGMLHSVTNFNSSTGILVLNTIIEDTFRSADLAAEFKKKIIFLPYALEKLRALIVCGNYTDVQNCVDRYLTSVEDKKVLKIRLFGDPVNEMRRFLVKHDENAWKSFLMWYFGDEKLVKQFRGRLAVDTIFTEMLINCVFDRYDTVTSRYEFKRVSDIKFQCLDRFLIWYFRSLECVKKYKLRKINSFTDTLIFHILMDEQDHHYLKAVIEWFFQNDRQEMEKFKAKYGKEHKKIIFVCSKLI